MEDVMRELVAAFPDHLREAKHIADAFPSPSYRPFDNVAIFGLGGSGIGGTIISQMLADECPVPINVVKDYDIPAYIGKRTLVIACSYSGNTEETLEAVSQAHERGAQIACITSGGKLAELSAGHGWPCVIIPGGLPPRAAFGYSFVQLLNIAEVYGLSTTPWKSSLLEVADHLTVQSEKISNAGRQLAEALVGHTPVIYSSTWLEGVAVRWRQQFNENSKILCWHHVYPEMNHNELVGWRSEDHRLAVIFLVSDLDNSRVVRRMELTKSVYSKYTPHLHFCKAVGKNKMAQAVYLIHLGDWTSVFLAQFRGVDATEVKVIDWLKTELGKA
ncbi:MAG: bifunctional phosphoglucose/phosphomannose isomerase [Salibacteraceae bacterium]